MGEVSVDKHTERIPAIWWVGGKLLSRRARRRVSRLTETWRANYSRGRGKIKINFHGNVAGGRNRRNCREFSRARRRDFTVARLSHTLTVMSQVPPLVPKPANRRFDADTIPRLRWAL